MGRFGSVVGFKVNSREKTDILFTHHPIYASSKQQYLCLKVVSRVADLVLGAVE